MYQQLQLPISPDKEAAAEWSGRLELERLGTFQDNLRAPIHRWFKYPAGYSYKLVEALVKDYALGSSSLILDPFLGSGTTAVTAKQCGLNSLGIEAHPFVHWVATVKCFWEYDLHELRADMNRLLRHLQAVPDFPGREGIAEFPELLHKCYSDENLWRLKFIRDSIGQVASTKEIGDFLKVALTNTLRSASRAGTGWPYIAPTKYGEKVERPAIEVFSKTVQHMHRDLLHVMLSGGRSPVKTSIYLMDARETYPTAAGSVDLAVTSPPYLNNFDYADRTRLEMYFFNWANTWGDITVKVRDKLITAATTQVRRTAFADDPLSNDFQVADPQLYRELSGKIKALSERRMKKGGKKSYDLMTAGYFNDMLQVMRQVGRVLKPGATFVLVLGDSAPYGVHLPVDEYLGRLGLAVGFSDYRIEALRTRGDKWKNNPQRHNVKLREVILFLEK